MLSARKVFLSFAILAPFSAYGGDFIRESFDGKTPGTALAGQAVEFSLEPQSWFEFTDPSSATTQWTVSDAASFAGPNSVRVDSGGEITSSLEASALGGYPTFNLSQPTYRLTGALNVASGGTNSGYGIGMGSDKLLGGLYILSSGEVVVLGGPGGGRLAYASPGAPLVVGLDAWHSLEARFVFSDESNLTASFFLDGSAVSFDGLSAGSYSLNTTKQPKRLYMEAASADGINPAFGQAHFDSLNLQAVPEPGTMVMLGLGIAALARRRR